MIPPALLRLLTLADRLAAPTDRLLDLLGTADGDRAESSNSPASTAELGRPGFQPAET